ncbi:MAG: hydroxyacid dehydrogenase, partial [Proteobacteria bacterium]|nr:hydroxyacid dehydrogenase [Pseudomonadota bacterium]
IIGLGQIGRRMAIRAAGFNMNVLVHEKFPDEQFIREQNLKLTGLDQLLQESDFISIHVPLTHETRNL